MIEAWLLVEIEVIRPRMALEMLSSSSRTSCKSPSIISRDLG